MNSQYLKKLAKMAIPDFPGVYFFIKKGRKTSKIGGKIGTKIRAQITSRIFGKKDILYIGRATSLRDRVKSYFKNDLLETRGPLLTDMLAQADSIEWRVTDSVLEAIILESNLIKKYQPRHNTKEKDDRSYNYVVITDEDFPRVMLVRGRELEKMEGTPRPIESIESSEAYIPSDDDHFKFKNNYKIKKKFGPYPQGALLREALAVIRKIFPFRDAKSRIPQNEAFYRAIGLSPDTSTPDAKKEYARTIRNITLFFEGKKKALIKALEKEMKAFAKSREFEKAGFAKKTLYALGHIQDVSLIKNSPYLSQGFRIEAYDIAHLGGDENVGVMTVIENGEIAKHEYRKFKISRNTNDDVGSLSEVLRRRFNHPEWRMPSMIVVDGGKGQINAAEKISNIPVVSVVKDDHHKARDIMKGKSDLNLDILIAKNKSSILLANAEAHRFAITFHRRRLSKKAIPRL